MGLPNWMNWLTWFFDAVFATFITVAIVILLLCCQWSSGYEKIITESNSFLIFIFIMLYGISLIWICFAMSTLFKSRKFKKNQATILLFFKRSNQIYHILSFLT